MKRKPNPWQDTISRLSEHLPLKRQERTSIGEDVEEREPLVKAGGDVNWFSHYGKTVWRCLKKLKKELSHDPAIPLLGTSPKETKTGFWRDYLHSQVHCSIMRSRQDMEKPSVFTQRMDKGVVYGCVHTYTYTHTHTHTHTHPWRNIMQP